MLYRYSEFSSSFKLNENLAGAKKILKDTYAFNKALKELDLGYKTDRSGLILYDSDDFKVSLKDLDSQAKEQAKNNVRKIKVSEDEQRQIERQENFQEIRQLLGDKLGWTSLFTYLFFVENIPLVEENGQGGLRKIFNDMVNYQDLLSKLRRPVANYIDPNITNNTEQLIDDLEDISRYRKLKKFIDEFNRELKNDYAQSPKFFKDKLVNIATSFDELGKDEDTGKIDFEEQRVIQKRFFSKIGRYRTVRELVAQAENFLKAESDAMVSKFYKAIEKCNKKYGDYGVKVMYDEGGLLIMEIKSFAACVDLFSNTSWCIAQYLNQWNNYVGGDTIFNKQYAILNFNLPPSDNKSIIGITIEPKQSVRACHLKDDAGAMSAFRKIFNKFEEDLELEKDFIFKGLVPMTDAEIDEKKRRLIANREVVKKGLTLDQLKKYVIEDGADVNASSGLPLENAVIEDSIEKVEFLLEYGASPNLKKKQEAIVNKVKSFEVLKLLIAKGAEITPIVFKSLVEDEEAVKFCLDNGLDPNFNDNMPLRMAVKNGSLKLVKLLEEYNVSSDNVRQRNTKHAAEYCHWDILEYFISKGGSYVQDFQEVLRWIGHTQKFSSESDPLGKKLSVLNRLQGYIDAGLVELGDRPYKIGNDRNCDLKQVIEKFGSIRNWVIHFYPDLQKRAQQEDEKKAEK
jgi:ankyrin repeat protein